jgi:hypothetical protein
MILYGAFFKFCQNSGKEVLCLRHVTMQVVIICKNILTYGLKKIAMVYTSLDQEEEPLTLPQVSVSSK